MKRVGEVCLNLHILPILKSKDELGAVLIMKITMTNNEKKTLLKEMNSLAEKYHLPSQKKKSNNINKRR